MDDRGAELGDEVIEPVDPPVAVALAEPARHAGWARCSSKLGAGMRKTDEKRGRSPGGRSAMAATSWPAPDRAQGSRGASAAPLRGPARSPPRCRERDADRRSRCGTSARSRRAHCLQRRAGAQRRVEVAALRRGQQFDRQHADGIVDHFQPSRRAAVRGHRHVILLIGRGRDRIDAGRVGALLVLRHQSGRRHLRDHEARSSARAWASERPAGRTAPGRPAWRCVARRATRSRTPPWRSCRPRTRPARRGNCRPTALRPFSAKISGLSETPLASVVEREPRPGAARRAPRPSPAVGSAGNTGPARARRRCGASRGWRLPLHQRAQRRRRLDLAAMAPQRVDARIERRVGAAGGVGRERSGDQRGLKQPLRVEQPGKCIGASRIACR